jgi:hypothetical protein
MQEKFEDTKGVIKNHKSQDRQCNGKDTKGVIRIRKSMDRQYNGEKTKARYRGNKSKAFCTFSFGHCVVCSSSIYGF